MKRIIISAFLVAGTMLNAFSQTTGTDLKRMNLKGNVATVEFFYKHVTEEWGEEKTVLSPTRRFYFNPSGNLVYAQILGVSEWYDSYADETAVTKQYQYDGSGRLVTVMYYHAKGEMPNSGIKEIGGFPEKAVYEYDASGRLHSITNYRFDSDGWVIDHGYYFPYRGEEYNEQSGYSEGAKEVWNYTADGFTHIVCDNEGRTLVREVATEKGKKVDGRGGISIYDDAGRLVACGGSFVASNGAASYSEYFGYNKQGDLVIESSNADAQKQIEIMPWLKASYNRHGDYFYQYVYDDHGNWIERKKFKTLNGNREPILENTLVRVIGYDSFDYFERAADQAAKQQDNEVQNALGDLLDKYNDYVSEMDPEKGLLAYRAAKKALEYDIPDVNDLANYIVAGVWPHINLVGEVRGEEAEVMSRLVGVVYAERAMREGSEMSEDARKLYDLYVHKVLDYDKLYMFFDHISSPLWMVDPETGELHGVGIVEEMDYPISSLKEK